MVDIGDRALRVSAREVAVSVAVALSAEARRRPVEIRNHWTCWTWCVDEGDVIADGWVDGWRVSCR